jgi:hypothetical protein
MVFAAATFVRNAGTMCMTSSKRKAFIQISDRDAALNRGKNRRQAKTPTASKLPSQIAEKRALTAAADMGERS